MERWKLQLSAVASVLALMAGFTLFKAPAGQAQTEGVQEQIAALQAEVAALKEKLKYVSTNGTDMVISGANVHIRNGLRATNGYQLDPESTSPFLTHTNGRGNLILGYNEARPGAGDNRDGSHNLVIGSYHNYGSFGCLVAGQFNTVTRPYASVSAGKLNTASGTHASVSGGSWNTASGVLSSVSAGELNTASGVDASVTGGYANWASAPLSSISAGKQNKASDNLASVSGGFFNTASGAASAVGGGQENTANGTLASISGGQGITQSLSNGWSGGSHGPATLSARFRSP